MTTKKKKRNKTGFTGKSRGEQHIVALHAPFYPAMLQEKEVCKIPAHLVRIAVYFTLLVQDIRFS